MRIERQPARPFVPEKFSISGEAPPNPDNAAMDAKLVYSTEPARNKACPRCKNLGPECTCAKTASKDKPGFTAVLRLEKNGRGGKTVTVIDRLPPSDNYLLPLEKLLKARAGAGGTHYAGASGGVIEIQGDKRDLIRKILSEKGIEVKG